MLPQLQSPITWDALPDDPDPPKLATCFQIFPEIWRQRKRWNVGRSACETLFRVRGGKITI